MEHMISCQGLSKNFVSYKKAPGFAGTVRSFFQREPIIKAAVADFTMTVGAGEFIGLLGPNGAGKTTLMKMMTGLIAPTSGNLSVLGYEPFQRAVAFRKKVALVMGQKSQLWWDIPAFDSFILLKRYYEIPDGDFDQRIKELSSLLGVEDVMHIHVRRLSLGERMKMELMASLLHRPDVIFLDEPTIGLDVVAQNNIRQFLKDYQKLHGTTVILTSHYMADVEALCSRIVLILGGAKRFDGPIRQFESLLGQEKFLSLSFDQPVVKDHPLLKPFDPQWDASGLMVELRVPAPELKAVTTRFLQELPVTDFATEKLPIERVMKTLLTRPELI